MLQPSLSLKYFFKEKILKDGLNKQVRFGESPVAAV